MTSACLEDQKTLAILDRLDMEDAKQAEELDNLDEFDNIEDIELEWVASNIYVDTLSLSLTVP